jgi:hypothetical protein
MEHQPIFIPTQQSNKKTNKNSHVLLQHNPLLDQENHYKGKKIHKSIQQVQVN